MAEFIDIGRPVNDPSERLILNASTVKSFSIVSRMGNQLNSHSLPESDSEFFMIVTLKNDEEYLIELDGFVEAEDQDLYRPEEPERMMDEFLSTLVDQLDEKINVNRLRL